jgi:hypothetical protein
MTERPHLQDARGKARRDGHKRTGEERAAEDVRGNLILAVNPAPPGSRSRLA